MEDHHITGGLSCTVCCKIFTRKDNLSRHMMSHSRKYDYFCEGCQKGFARKYMYEEHKMVVHEGRRFYCDCCGTGFTSKVNLHNHKKKDHEVKWKGENPHQESQETWMMHHPLIVVGPVLNFNPGILFAPFFWKVGVFPPLGYFKQGMLVNM